MIRQFCQSPALRRLLASMAGRIGLGLTSFLGGAAVLAPFLNPYNPAQDRNYAIRLQAPNGAHWFGLDGLGRDIFTQVWYGIRTSLEISLISVLLGLLAGVLLGLLAGYFRGWVDGVIGWLTDVMLAFPSILLAIAVVTVTGPSRISVMVAVGLVQVPKFIRLTRSLTLSLREQAFVQAAQAFGAGPGRIMARHLLPACLSALTVQATLAIGTATLEAAGLGFLGLGTQPPAPELGTMLSDAFKGGYSLSAPWTILFPGLFITLMVLAFTLLGDGLRDALHPPRRL
ncbi:ABC transporter permease [Lyngbya confervoides]|uniref:ABC transporter permease n=1 Tax=Lyngbya confervoides BDU141951 TaxID=1574623 RepID=A0ABD4SZV6_9CYAN|nr:ABC transporter permease [Lyngbya confervoides]MCM1981888.1 ABC transporter permease [Lyngbya confervoides BDU141951]